VYDRIAIESEGEPVSDDAQSPRKDTGRDRPHRAADRRDDLSERREDVLTPTNRAAITELHRYYGLLDACPEVCRDWLRQVIDEHIIWSEQEALNRQLGESTPGGWAVWTSEDFLREAERIGVVRTIFSNVAQDDPTPKEARRGEDNQLPNTRVVWPLVCHVLTTDRPPGENHWLTYRVTAAKSIRRYAPTPELAHEWLLRYLGETWEVGYHAAVQLAETHPDTPGLVERLLGAMTAEWVASFFQDLAGADAAVSALHGVLTHTGQAAPSELLDRAVREFRGGHPNRLRDLWVGWSGRPLEDFPATAARSLTERPDEWFSFWLDLPAEVSARTQVLFTLFRSEPRLVCDEIQRRGLPQLTALCQFALSSEVVLPALVGWWRNVNIYFNAGDHALILQALTDHLTALPGRRADWTEEDGWLASLCGQPLSEFAWVVYADWLEDRGDADRAYQLRLLHAHATDPANAPTTSDSDPGAEWAPVYSHIASAPPV